VFEANLGDVEDDSLPSLSGPDGSSVHMLAMLQQLQPVLARVDARIDSVLLSGRGSWRVELDSGAEVELGRGTDEEVLARTERFVSTLTQVTSRYQRPLEYADLRHNDGFAVRLKGITTVIPTPKNQKR
jgi:cell division protein FtsQ